jgi:hypothetical protein
VIISHESLFFSLLLSISLVLPPPDYRVSFQPIIHDGKWSCYLESKGFKRVSTSTGETEYVAVYEVGRQAKWLIQWIQEVEIYKELPFKIKCNNNTAITVMKNVSSHSCMKHTNIKHHWIHKVVNITNFLLSNCASSSVLLIHSSGLLIADSLLLAG